jgi:hypothetical protein
VTSWAYRATPSGTSYHDTVRILLDHGFLWRPLYRNTALGNNGTPPLNSNLAQIDPATDELFIYFADGYGLRCVGAFVFAPRRANRPVPLNRAPAIVEVPAGDPLEAVLRAAGYSPDPFLQRFTGFDLLLLEDGTTAPFLPLIDGRSALYRFPSVDSDDQDSDDQDPDDQDQDLDDSDSDDSDSDDSDSDDSDSDDSDSDDSDSDGSDSDDSDSDGSDSDDSDSDDSDEPDTDEQEELIEPTSPPVQPDCNGASPSLCLGVDWSGAALAGNKIWVAELDGRTRSVTSVRRRWPGVPAADAVESVRQWLATVGDCWIGLDFPFGLAVRDRSILLPRTDATPRSWGSALRDRFPTVEDFRNEAVARSLIGVHPRGCDRGAPFSPLLFQLIYQTYWGLRLLGQLPPSVAILPWEHDATATTRMLETCPAMLLRALGESNVGYKLKAGSGVVRANLLDRVLRHPAIRWTCPPEVHQQVIADHEGDALDAILAGLAAWRASSVDHAGLAKDPRTLAEGHIYA